MNKLAVIDNRKYNDLALKEQWKPGGEFDPETQTVGEWKEKIAEKGLKYGSPEPLLFNILVRQSGSEHHKHSRDFALNLEIPTSYRQKPGIGVVVAVGTSVPAEILKPGDLIKFGLLSEEVEFEGEKFQLVDYRDVKWRQPVYNDTKEVEDEKVSEG